MYLEVSPSRQIDTLQLDRSVEDLSEEISRLPGRRTLYSRDTKEQKREEVEEDDERGYDPCHDLQTPQEVPIGLPIAHTLALLLYLIYNI